MTKKRAVKSVRVKEHPFDEATRREHQRIHENLKNDDGLIRRAQESKARCEAARVRFRDVTAALKAAREAKGLSLRDLEAITGIGSGSLSLLENGKGNPTMETLERIADAIGAEITITVTV